MTCNYCGRVAELVNGEAIYPHRADLHHKRFYRCAPCAAWVGCHGTSVLPLGRLANAELRRAKNEAHVAFDGHWKGRSWSRAQAYKWLAAALNIDPSRCHIGMFDVDECRRVVELCAQEAVSA